MTEREWAEVLYDAHPKRAMLPSWIELTVRFGRGSPAEEVVQRSWLAMARAVHARVEEETRVLDGLVKSFKQRVGELEGERERLRGKVAELTDETEARAGELLQLREESERPKCLYCAFGELHKATHEELAHHILHDCQRHPVAALAARVAELEGMVRIMAEEECLCGMVDEDGVGDGSCDACTASALLARAPGAGEQAG